MIDANVPTSSKSNLPLSSLDISCVVRPISKPLFTVFDSNSCCDAAIRLKDVCTVAPLGKVIIAPSLAVNENLGSIPVLVACNSSGKVKTLTLAGSVVTTLCANCGLISTVLTADFISSDGNTFLSCSCIKSDCKAANPCSSSFVTFVASIAHVPRLSSNCLNIVDILNCLAAVSSISVFRSSFVSSTIMSLYLLINFFDTDV